MIKSDIMAFDSRDTRMVYRNGVIEIEGSVMRKRIVDKNGGLVNYPRHYHEALHAACCMINELESDNIDRSDMHVAINSLMTDIKFHLTFLKDKGSKDDL